MQEFTVIDGSKRWQGPSAESAKFCDQLDDPQFGVPPNLIVGLLTGLCGSAAGVLSLFFFFFAWEPDHYITPEWLIFVLMGGVIGFFLRIERPIIREMYTRKVIVEKRRK